MGSLSSWPPPQAYLGDYSHTWTLLQANQLGMGWGRWPPLSHVTGLISEVAPEDLLSWAMCGGSLTPPISSDAHRRGQKGHWPLLSLPGQILTMWP